MEYIIKSNSYRLSKDKINELTLGIEKDNISYFDLNIDSINVILEEASYNSLFDSKKAIIVYNSNIFGTKYEYKDDLELLEKYLNNSNSNTILIFLSDSISLKKKCVKMIKDNDHLFELSMPIKDDLNDKIKDYLSKYNYKIENKALTKLINNLDSNYDYILNELDKVMLVKKDYLINLDDIEKYTISIKSDNIFDFVNVIIKKDTKKIKEYLDNYIYEKLEPAILFSNIANQYRLIYVVKNLVKNGYSEKKIAEELDIHPYRVKIAYENSFNYRDKELIDILLSIGEYDEKIKSGLLDKYVALKVFLLNL
ncbi:MAG: DNA polymerase III subunit delta [Bacilli bacterium]|nr:DNA polymerase III subunit delta [Bacilli bacterium]